MPFFKLKFNLLFFPGTFCQFPFQLHFASISTHNTHMHWILETSVLTVMSDSFFTCLPVWPWHGRDSGASYHGNVAHRCQGVKSDSVCVWPLECGLVKTKDQMAHLNKEPLVTTALRQVMYPTSHPHLFNSACLSLSLSASHCIYRSLRSSVFHAFALSHCFLPPSHILHLSVHLLSLTPSAPGSSWLSHSHSQANAAMCLHPCIWMNADALKHELKNLVAYHRYYYFHLFVFTVKKISSLSSFLFCSTLDWSRLEIISKQGIKEANADYREAVTSTF